MYVKALTTNMDLVYSSDDHGWYLQEYHREGEVWTRVSQIFTTKQAALDAWAGKKGSVIEWSEWS